MVALFRVCWAFHLLARIFLAKYAFAPVNAAGHRFILKDNCVDLTGLYHAPVIPAGHRKFGKQFPFSPVLNCYYESNITGTHAREDKYQYTSMQQVSIQLCTVSLNFLYEWHIIATKFMGRPLPLGTSYFIGS